jgi:hypothetical protein
MPVEPASDHRETCSTVRPNRTTGVHKPSWLAAVDGLSQSAMEKCILDIKLVHRPRPRESQRENSVHCSRLHHWTESLIIVHAKTLSKPPKDPTRLIALPSTISSSLDRPNPLVGHHIATRRTPHKVPSLVGKKSAILFHRTTPVRIYQSRTDRRQDRREPRLPSVAEGARGRRTPAACRVTMGWV